eukprot:1836016-Rhodomonas_salina.1
MDRSTQDAAPEQKEYVFQCRFFEVRYGKGCCIRFWVRGSGACWLKPSFRTQGPGPRADCPCQWRLS